MKHLYFCRHGLSELGKAGLWAGSSDTPLAPEGREQATTAGQSAKDLGITYIISSPLLRAHETALIIAQQIGFPTDKIECNKLVVERDFGPLEATAWDPNFDVDSIVGVEPSDSILLRAQKTWDYLQTVDADNILLVSHGSFGRALRHVIHPEIAFDTKGRFENAQIVRLV